MALGKDVFRGRPSNSIALRTIGVMHRKKVVSVGVVQFVPVYLRDLRVAVHPFLELSLDFPRAMGIGHVIARQVPVVVGTRVSVLTPFEAGLTHLASEVIGRGVERGPFVRCPIPSELGHRLMISAHARIADDLLARSIHRLITPVWIVIIGADQIVSLLHHRGRTAALRGRTKHREVDAVLVIDFLLHREEITVGLVEGAFGIALARITTAGMSHQIPALPHLACADRSHNAMVVRAVGEGIAQRNLLAVL